LGALLDISPGYLRGSGDHTGQFPRRRLRLQGGVQEPQARFRAAEQTQPTTIAQTLHPDPRPGLPDSDPEPPGDGEVLEGRADLSDHTPGGEYEHRSAERSGCGRTAVQNPLPYLSAQLCGALATSRTAAEVCEPVNRSSKRGIDRGVYECANVRRSAFFGRGGISLIGILSMRVLTEGFRVYCGLYGREHEEKLPRKTILYLR